FACPPPVVAMLVWVWGFGSLLWCGWRTRSITRSILVNPSFLVGDGVLLPTVAYSITAFYQLVDHPLALTFAPAWNAAAAIFALLATTVSAVRFRLFNPWFVPHGLFYGCFAYIVLTFFSKGLYQLVVGESTVAMWLLWLSALVGVVAHLVL